MKKKKSRKTYSVFEDIIAHVQEMTMGEGEDAQPVGLQMTRPCRS